ncbi:MAG TPA: polyhydroxyalkanoic acid system family protein [Puia sp.]|nr:polyhydroxyalkanoic acid system family protein [Puia sp.]
MDIQVSHTHTREEAKKRIESLIRGQMTRYGNQITDLKEHWDEYTGKFEGSAKGYSVSGTVEIDADSVTVELKVPFVLRVFSKKIRSVVEDYLKKTLS